MATKAKSQKVGSGKIAAYVSKYGNKGSGAGYKNAIEAFLRCIFNLPKTDDDGHRVEHDYETYLDQYIADKKRNQSTDVKTFSECLIKESVSKQSARQRLTYAVKFLRAQGISILKEDVQDIKREAKGGAATIDKALTAGVICQAIKGADVRNRAIILTLASSGLRVGELLSLEMKDIDLESTPVMINIRASKTKNKQARFTFITPEATEAVKAWLKNRDEYLQQSAKHNQNFLKSGIKTAPVQTESTLLFPVSDSQVNQAWESCLKKAGLYSKDSESGRNVYRLHSLRKFFISSVSLAGARTLAEHLAGHMGYLDSSYRQVSPEYAAAEYLKIQNILTVCIDPVVKRELTTQKEAITNLTEKTTLQGESVEYLRALNEKLAARNEALESRINAAENWYKTDGVKMQEQLQELQNVVAMLSQPSRPETDAEENRRLKHTRA